MGWRNPRWASLKGSDSHVLQAIFKSLEDWTKNPSFENGVQLGDGTQPTYDAGLDKVHLPALKRVDSANYNTPADGSVTRPKIAPDAVGAEELDAVAISVDKYIRSSDYTPGESGWAIDGDGDAEFNNVTVRGSFYSGSDGQHIEILSNPTDANSILFSTGETAEQAAGRITVTDFTDRGTIRITPPDFNADPNRSDAYLSMTGTSEDGTVGSVIDMNADILRLSSLATTGRVRVDANGLDVWNGNFNVAGNASVGGGLTVTGNASTSGSFTATGMVNANGGLRVVGNGSPKLVVEGNGSVVEVGRYLDFHGNDNAESGDFDTRLTVADGTWFHIEGRRVWMPSGASFGGYVGLRQNSLYLHNDGDNNHRLVYFGHLNGPELSGYSTVQLRSQQADANFRLQNDGNAVLYDNGGAWGMKSISSSRTRKQDVEDYDVDAMAMVRDLRPVTFKRIYDDPRTKRRQELAAVRSRGARSGQDKDAYERELAEGKKLVLAADETWSTRLDPAVQTPELGFIAEEVEQVEPRLVMPASGDMPKSLMYQQMTAMLAKALQQLDSRVLALETTVAAQQAELAQLRDERG